MSLWRSAARRVPDWVDARSAYLGVGVIVRNHELILSKSQTRTRLHGPPPSKRLVGHGAPSARYIFVVGQDVVQDLPRLTIFCASER